MNKKILTLEQLKSFVEVSKKNNKKIVTTNGVFDLLHKGHITYLQQAKSLGDVLIVGVNSDTSVKRLKGETRPLNSQDDRAFCLAALECVDIVVVFDEDDPRELLKTINPNIHVKGGDYNEEEIVEKEIVESGGGTIALLDVVKGYSTTSLIQKIKTS